MQAPEKIYPITEFHSLKSNEPLIFDNPDAVALVQTGSIALFALSRQTKGRRRYLFSVKAGELVFPVSLCDRNTPYQILALALEETELQQFSQEEFRQHLKEQPHREIDRLETWVHRLSSTLSGLTATKLPTPIASQGILEAGEVYQPPQGSIVWLRLLQGQAKLLGLPELDLTTQQGQIPFSTHLWLRAIDTIELDVCSKHEISSVDTLLNGLENLQQLVFTAIEQLEQQEFQQEWRRFQERQQLNQSAVTQTLDQFAGLFHEQRQKGGRAEEILPPDPETALLMAAGAVGRAMGITICPPAASEDLRRVRNPLEAIARASRIRMRRVTLRDDWWQKNSGALLAYTSENRRPVALLPVGETQYEVYDPLHGMRTKCDRTIAATLSPVAFTFYRSLPDEVKPLTLMKFALGGHWKELALVLLTGIAATLLGMVTPQATAILIDQAIPDANGTLLLQIALGLFSVALGTTLFQLTQSIALMRLEVFADSTTQAAVWDRLLKLQTSFFRQYAIGDLSARVSAISQIRQRLGNTILKSLFSGVFSFLNLGLLFYYSVPLALIATLVAAINIGVTIASGVFTLKKVRPLLDYQGKLSGVMVQMINGISKFRVAGAETRAFAYWGKQYRDQLKLTLGSQGIEDNLAVINSLLSAITPAVLFGCATMLLQQSQVNNGSFSTGTFLAFNAAFGTFIAGATSLSTIALDVIEVLPIWQRALPILEAQPEIDATKADPGRLSGQISVSNVVFRYRSDGALTLDDVSLRAEPGEFIALVGPSGSGKSTLFRLLLGFDLPESGTIAYDGQDLAGVDVNAVRRQLGVVLQNSRLMSGSIFENISSNAVITMEEAWEAARMAGLADDIGAMPMGMHTVVSEGGTNLSGGQRQRLLIARALALRPRILLFDEATSALDNKTQAIVSESLDRLKVTRIVVAHRLSTIRNADRIYVLQNGRLVQQGDFEQLATEEGLFRQLMQRQQL
ncbi:NHLP bacteriocin export ABC transporter permease/ATPase subunit [Leptolyngbya ohadii]|uniref:NHLP bacteriocin export ABC transporter permease/ATPase subunit n=1 Tax=Leptolyngbya ohadii TaxID=1962290 RepID=UPI000B598DD8|nr:NHLP bacteriocin export ABC transporter permease/ATPase subunit [Leptolyngbya ohadii]